MRRRTPRIRKDAKDSKDAVKGRQGGRVQGAGCAGEGGEPAKETAVKEKPSAKPADKPAEKSVGLGGEAFR